MGTIWAGFEEAFASGLEVAFADDDGVARLELAFLGGDHAHDAAVLLPLDVEVAHVGAIGLAARGSDGGQHVHVRDVRIAAGLLDFADSYPKALSGGMKQRVAIARTLLNNPAVLLMDEPFGALDPNTRWGMQGLVLDMLRRNDNTVLFVTHDVSEAVYLADVIYVLSSRPAQILHRIEVPFFADRSLAVMATWPLAPCEEPTGMGADLKNHRLIIGCGNKLMAIMNSDDGHVVVSRDLLARAHDEAHVGIFGFAQRRRHADVDGVQFGDRGKIAGRLQLAEEFREELHLVLFDQRQLPELAFVLPVVRGVVMR